MFEAWIPNRRGKKKKEKKKFLFIFLFQSLTKISEITLEEIGEKVTT